MGVEAFATNFQQVYYLCFGWGVNASTPSVKLLLKDVVSHGQSAMHGAWAWEVVTEGGSDRGR